MLVKNELIQLVDDKLNVNPVSNKLVRLVDNKLIGQ